MKLDWTANVNGWTPFEVGECWMSSDGVHWALESDRVDPAPRSSDLLCGTPIDYGFPDNCDFAIDRGAPDTKEEK